MSVLQLKTATVDLTWLTVSREGEVVPLTETEGALLRYLVGRAGHDVARDELQRAVGSAGTPRAIDIAVARLRAKLGEADQPYHVRTVRGVGYRFVGTDAPTAPAAPAPSLRPPILVATGKIDLDRREFVDLSGAAHPLGKLDVDLLEQLAAGGAVPRERLTRDVWGRGKHERSLSAALRRLRDRLGDDPERPAIVVSHDGALRLVPLAVDRTSRTNTRPPRTPFIDRPEVEELLAALRDSPPLVTVRGPAGIGKTRLVYEAGLRLLDREPAAEVWFCDLSCALAEQGIVRAMETALGIEQGPATDPALRIGRVLARKPAGTLILLDNFDQVTQHTAALEAMIRQAPAVRFVATSRHALGLPFERCVDVGPLEVDAAARLFVGRAGAPALDPRSESVRTLVQRLDCLPLALELAAARAGEFTVDELVSRLGDRLNWLVRPPADAVSPHRSLRGALDWSWDLLDESGRRALAQCAVFARAFSAGLAAEVLTVPEPAHALHQLAARSLLDRVGDRWRQFEGIRDYAREKLILAGQLEAASLRHAEVVVRRGEAAVARLRGSTLVEALAELRELRDDLQIVHTRALPASVQARAAIVLVPLLQIEGPRSMIDTLCAEYAGRPDDQVPPALRSQLRLALGERARLHGRWAEADEHLARALGEASGVGRAQVLRERASAWVDAGRGADAEAPLREALDTFRAAGDRIGELDVLRYLAKGRITRGEADAVAELEAVRVSLLELGDPLRSYHLHRDLAGVHLERGELDAAEARVRASLAWARELNLRRGEWDGWWWLAQIARQRADFAVAERLLVDAGAGYEALGEDERARLMRRLLALVWVEAGRAEDAEVALSEAYHASTDPVYRSIDLANLAVVWHLLGRHDAAIQAFRRLLDEVAAGPMRDALELHLAAVQADDDQVDAAAAHLEAVATELPLREVAARIVELARARAGSTDRGFSLTRARGTLAELRRSPPAGGPSVVRRDQDLNIASMLLERAIHRSEGASS
ncbi:MAG: winged helix-turn-helix domain-containing protein [Myxococcota bacterium]